MRRFVLFALFLSLALLLAACQRDRVVGVPPTPTAAQAPSTLPSPTLIAEVALNPTVSITMPAPAATTVLSATAVMTTSVEATARQALYIRNGPGLGYASIGTLAAKGRVEMLGRSADGAWLRITCPTGLDAPECWIVSDESFWDFEQPVALPTAPAPPLPPPMPTPTPLPCVVMQPAGWVSNSIAAGDTLSDLASRFGVSVSQLQGVNCLDSDAIVAGQTIFVPAPSRAQTTPGPVTAGSAAAAATAAAVGPGPVPPPPVADDASRAPARASIGFYAPNRDDPECLSLSSCGMPAQDISQPLQVDTTNVACRHSDQFEVVDRVCIYILNLDPSQPSSVTISRAGIAPVQALAPEPGENAWTYFAAPGVLKAGETSQSFQVQVTQGSRSASASFTVSRASSLRMSVSPRVVAPGGRVQVAGAGLKPGMALYLYRLSDDCAGEDPTCWKWVPNHPIRSLLPDAYGEVIHQVDTYPSDAGQCFLVDTGDLTEAGKPHPAVFGVGIDPARCGGRE